MPLSRVLPFPFKGKCWNNLKRECKPRFGRLLTPVNSLVSERRMLSNMRTIRDSTFHPILHTAMLFTLISCTPCCNIIISNVSFVKVCYSVIICFVFFYFNLFSLSFSNWDNYQVLVKYFWLWLSLSSKCPVIYLFVLWWDTVNTVFPHRPHCYPRPFCSL